MIRVTTEFGGVTGTPWVSQMYFAGSDAAAAAGASSDVSVFWTNLEDRIEDSVTYVVSGEVPSIDPATGDIIEVHFVTSNSGSGSATGDPLPRANQGLIRWRTGIYLSGREVRGRTFVPGPVEIDSGANGVPTPTYVSDLAAAANTLVGLTSDLGVWSPTHGVFHVATGSSAWNQFAVLRSRRD
jgi:hypothetical protein